MAVSVISTGLVQYQRLLERNKELAPQALRMALNQTAERKGLKMARDAISLQVDFGRAYLQDPRHLSVAQKATTNNLEAIIRGSDTPAGLARFLVGGPTPLKTGLTIRIKPGRTEQLPKAFLMNFRSGYVGLAVRLAPGDRLRNKHSALPLKAGSNVFLLYGPSVDQVFRGVASDISTPLSEALVTEFLRQYDRLVLTGG